MMYTDKYVEIEGNVVVKITDFIPLQKIDETHYKKI